MNLYIKVIFVGFIIFSLSSCQPTKEEENKETLILPEKPNILWLVAEDLSPVIPSFGDSTVQTPNLSRLAAEGVCYTNFYSPSGVCAPSRAAIATGMYPTNIAANHMRTGPWYAQNVPADVREKYKQYMPEGIPPYEAIPPAEVKMMSEVLRKAGYYCSNNSKNDYQFLAPVTAWDENSNKAHWRNRKAGQPFFSIFNFGVTHESRIWAKAKDSLWIAEDLEVPVPPYLPDTEVGKKDVRRMYSNIVEMDFQVGKILTELEEDGLLDSTIIIWYTDHGGPLPRQKRLLYDSGIKVPMIIRFPQKQKAGERANQLISFIDLAPSMFSLAGLEPLTHLDGQSFLGEDQAAPRKYIHAAADRFDESYDANRAVRDKRYKYIRYYEPEKPMFLHNNYRDQMPIMQELYRLRDAGELTETQALWFRETKPKEEFFDTEKDPHEINNLADDPAYADKLNELRAECDRWIGSFDDTGLIPEKELIAILWKDGEQPVTGKPSSDVRGRKIHLTSETLGASIGYQILTPGESSNHWEVYTEPFELPEGKELKVVAHRIGYLPSEL